MAKRYVYSKPEESVAQLLNWPIRLLGKHQTIALTPLLFRATVLPSPEQKAMLLMGTGKLTGMASDRMEALTSELRYLS